MLAAEEAQREPGGHGEGEEVGGERRRRSEPPRKLWHASPGSSGR